MANLRTGRGFFHSLQFEFLIFISTIYSGQLSFEGLHGGTNVEFI
jgi:hypothetical protein